MKRTPVFFALSEEDARAGRIVEHTTGCVLDRLGISDHCSSAAPRVQILFSATHATLFLCRASSASPEDKKGVPLLHPPYCPLLRSPPQSSALTAFAASAVVVSNARNDAVLLTRRSERLRSFPGTWVVPGGHVDLGESPDVAALRELSEEVGLTLHQSRQSPLRLLGVYESVFPSLLEWGPPSRMHALLYYHLRLSNTDEDSFDLATTRCSVGEVGAMAWVPVHIVRHLLCRFFSSDDATGSAPPLPAAKEEEEEEVVHGVSIDPESGAATPDTFSVSGSLVPDLHNRKERVTTGTLFALREWLTSCSD